MNHINQTKAEQLADELPNLLISLDMNTQETKLIGETVGHLLWMQERIDILTDENAKLRNATRLCGGSADMRKRK